MAALGRRANVAVANMIGSSSFNILGITALLAPVPVAPAMVRTDMRWMMGTALLVLPLLWSGRVFTRVEGGILAGAYVMYDWILLR